jgi:hypothetical protein
MRNIAGILVGILFPMFALAFNANAVQLISNGGFETGLTGWAVTSSVGSGGSWFPDITTSRKIPNYQYVVLRCAAMREIW